MTTIAHQSYPLAFRTCCCEQAWCLIGLDYSLHWFTKRLRFSLFCRRYMRIIPIRYGLPSSVASGSIVNSIAVHRVGPHRPAEDKPFKG